MTLNSIILFLMCFAALWSSTQVGRVAFGRGTSGLMEGSEDFRMILGAILSLLGLIIGFTLSMSIGGYNGRQAGEEAEAAAIHAAYFRADLLPAEDSAKMRSVLDEYVDKRLEFYRAADNDKGMLIRRQTIRIQERLWAIGKTVAADQPTPVIALVIASINDVISAQKKTQAGWRNQIPVAAWLLLGAIAVCCNLLIGYNTRQLRRKGGLLLILPLMISLSFMMIADIDVPGRGIIRVHPVNLEYLQGMIKQPG